MLSGTNSGIRCERLPEFARGMNFGMVRAANDFVRRIYYKRRLAMLKSTWQSGLRTSIRPRIRKATGDNRSEVKREGKDIGGKKGCELFPKKKPIRKSTKLFDGTLDF